MITADYGRGISRKREHELPCRLIFGHSSLIEVVDNNGEKCKEFELAVVVVVLHIYL